MKKITVFLFLLFLSLSAYAYDAISVSGWKVQVDAEAIRVENSKFVKTLNYLEGAFVSFSKFDEGELAGFGISESFLVGWTDSLMLNNRILVGSSLRTTTERPQFAAITGLAVGYELEAVLNSGRTNLFLIGFGTDIQLGFIKSSNMYGIGTALSITAYPFGFGNYSFQGDTKWIKIERYGRVEIGLTFGIAIANSNITLNF